MADNERTGETGAGDVVDEIAAQRELYRQQREAARAQGAEADRSEARPDAPGPARQAAEQLAKHAATQAARSALTSLWAAVAPVVIPILLIVLGVALLVSVVVYLYFLIREKIPGAAVVLPS